MIEGGYFVGVAETAIDALAHIPATATAPPVQFVCGTSRLPSGSAAVATRAPQAVPLPSLTPIPLIDSVLVVTVPFEFVTVTNRSTLQG